MLRKMRTLSDRRGAGRSDLDAQTTDRLVSAVVEGDTAPTAESAGERLMRRCARRSA